MDKADAPLGPDQLQEAAGVPRRTMYFALDCLLRIGLVRVGIPLEDTRQRRYRLDPAHTMGRWQPCFKQGKCG